MNLLIIESAGKIPTLKKILPDFEVIATGGHFKRLLTFNKENLDKQEINYVNEWEAFNNKPVPQGSLVKQQNIEKMLSLANQANKIYIATDGDREGEAIGFHVKEMFPKNLQSKIKRVVFNEITQEEVLNKISKPVPFDKLLYQAQQARAVQDQMIGFGFSQLAKKIYSEKVSNNNTVSVGRVQSVVLEILKQELNTKNDLSVKLEPKDTSLKSNQTIDFEDVESANKLIRQLNKPIKCIVKEVNSTTAFKEPLNTYDFLKVCALKYPLVSVKNISETMQKLYEKGAITYPRTDSKRISRSWVDKNEKLISKFSFFAITPDLKNRLSNPLGSEETISDVKIQNAHEALRVTDFKMPFGLNEFEQDIFQMLKQSTLDYFTPQIQYKIKLEPDQILQLEKPIEIIITNPITATQFKLNKVINLPFKKPNNTPKPLSRFDLINKLQQFNIGRPATIASMVEINNEKKNTTLDPNGLLWLTSQGQWLCDFIETKLSSIINIDFTSQMEKTIDKIADGKANLWDVLNNVYKNIESAKNQKPKPVSQKTINNENGVAKPPSKHKL